MDDTQEVNYVHEHSYRTEEQKLISAPVVDYLLYLGERQQLVVWFRGPTKSIRYGAIESETMDAIRTQMRQAHCRFTEASMGDIVLINIHSV
jgi:hypothetical protein